MISNKEIARHLTLTAQLMELYDENPFKIKSYLNAALKIKKMDVRLVELPLAELEKVDGIGKSTASKIMELHQTGAISDLTSLLNKTPEGIVDMLSIKGIGPKKVKDLWQGLGVETTGELLYACNENRLVELKGFGAKTQEQIKKAIEFSISNNGKFHYASARSVADLFDALWETNAVVFSITSAMRRLCEIVTEISYVVQASVDKTKDILATSEYVIPDSWKVDGEQLHAQTSFGIPLVVYHAQAQNFAQVLFQTTATEAHINLLPTAVPEAATEEAIYQTMKLPYILPELREGLLEVQWAQENRLPQLVEMTDLKGILHNHSTYSDGHNTLTEMASYCKELGYQYLGICDHSQSAFYANGLKPERVVEQHQEIEALNKKLFPFKIFKGIESDILNDGSLDYDEQTLQTFDFIVASVHSNLKMDEEKATARIIKAVENPYTTILGHPTGRLLLARAGYPINHKKVIDACAANGVAIELNAHPYRLDLDWRWIQYALSKQVYISINPDAHNKNGYHDMLYGVCVARKGGLTSASTLNAMTMEEIQTFFFNKRTK